MYTQLKDKKKTLAVVGLGYVGLPIALAFARKFRVIGFDINKDRIAAMQAGQDPSQELGPESFEGTDIQFTADEAILKEASFFVVAVPTDVDPHKVPDLTPLKKASATVGRALSKGDYVVYESTVYPGCTEEDCMPILESESNLKGYKDFKIGYSPERISPGDKSRTVTDILKIVAGCDEESTENIAKIYSSVIKAGVYRASTIKVAEAAKVIENTQRDLNISLVNELAIIFDRMDIDTKEVLAAAGTKWNFQPYSPGLVGGHCIGVDPYYLLHKSKQLGYDPQVILSGRRVNDGMPAFVAKRLVQLLTQKGKNLSGCKVLVMGITFKENVADIRNSKVVDVVRELMDYSINVHIHDPHASPNEVAHAYRLTLQDEISTGYDAVIIAVGHREFLDLDHDYFINIQKENPILLDIKGIYKREEMNSTLTYWRL
ncbi:MAG: nucleotide sugar dehydrogenase [Lewinellaceae bacterium]|nr:nucleotide sugar dehydrogenase [Lewinellaceae bacterium]MCB9329477.1 nucleotide sugar dehydrogenase [Lewinellaceae bacterium]